MMLPSYRPFLHQYILLEHQRIRGKLLQVVHTERLDHPHLYVRGQLKDIHT